MERDNEESRQGSSSIRKFTEYDKNPFISNMVSHVTMNSKDRVAKWTTRTGTFISEIDGKENDVFIGIKKRVDSESYTKIYKRTLKEIMGFSEGCVKLLMYIAEKLEKESLQIDFYIEDCIAVTGLGPATIYRGLTELLKKEVIARKSQRSYIYFINPVVLFNGNRLNIIRQIERDRSLDEPGSKEELNDRMQALGQSSFEKDVNNDFG